MELIACNESLGEVNIRRGIFQGDSFSPLLFVVVLIPLSIIVNKTDLRYVTSQNQKLKHVYGRFEAVCKSERELDSLIQTEKFF